MDWQAWTTLAVIAFVFVVLVRGLAPPDMVLWGGAVLVAILGIIDPHDLLSGLADPAVATVGALFVISAALSETGALDWIGGRLLGRARTETGAFVRLAPQISLTSAFLNNTAVVAMFMPVITTWCRKQRVSPSRFLLPLSYLSILGGMCTLIGTSTNLIVSGLMNRADERFGLDEMGMFELAWIGVPSAVVGTAYLFFVGRWFLPDRKDLLERFGEATREYLVEIRVMPNCPLVGKRVDEAGLRRLPGLFLIEVVREGQIIAPVEPDQVLQAGDQLTFSGAVTTIVDLERIPGLVPIADEEYDATVAERMRRRYAEAVISATSPLIGKNIRESNFRALYNAAVVAVHRGGTRLAGRIGDIVLRAGDTLLIQAGPHFAAANRNSPDFFLVSRLEEARPVRHERAWLSIGMLGLLVVALALHRQFGVSVAVVALAIAGALIIARCISAGDARRAVRLDVLFTIAAAFALGAALEKSGAAHAIAIEVVGMTKVWGARATLAAVYGIVMLIHAMVTSNATAVLMFPLAIEVAEELGVDARPFAIAVAAASAAAFATPMSYQTNMMVYGPGGYRFSDFLRVGIPLHVILWVLAVFLIPVIWPFSGG